MKIFIMTDMEGVCGVLNHDDWVTPAGRYYEEGKKLLTLEVNAAVEGFYAAGATEIYVADGHGYGGITQSLLDNRTMYVRGFPGPWPFTLTKDFDAVAWVGQHAKAGTEYAHMAHTGWFNVLDYKINGISVGEFGQLAMCAAYLGVRSIFAAGDEAFTKEAAALIKGIETVAVKRGLTPGTGDNYDTEGYRNRNLAAVHFHPEKARELIKEGAERALRRFIENKESFQLLELKPPFRREIEYRPNGSTSSYKAYAEHESNFIKMMNSSEIKLVK
ncbi:MAG: M55 family metallopeptidase [Firmicutes bacterium]|nr:M55 family metallopeptidase [Bacillota bacterium]